MNVMDRVIGRALILCLISVVMLAPMMMVPVAADDPTDAADDMLCGGDADADPDEDDLAYTIQLVLTILSALGPIFGTIFFIGLSVAAAATTDSSNEYVSQRRTALILGFSVPIAVAFLGAIANQLTSAEIGCFFP